LPMLSASANGPLDKLWHGCARPTIN